MLVGGSDNDYMDGEAGDDWLDARDGADIAFGGTGNDTICADDGTTRTTSMARRAWTPVLWTLATPFTLVSDMGSA